MHLEEMHRQVGTAFENKGKAKGEGNTHIEDTQRLVTEEIEMLLKVVFCI